LIAKSTSNEIGSIIFCGGEVNEGKILNNNFVILTLNLYVSICQTEVKVVKSFSLVGNSLKLYNEDLVQSGHFIL
jgi:hypothetical protein